jgi:flagellar motor protein MotB
MQRPPPRGAPPAPEGLSTLLVAALAFGAAGFGFGAYFYLVPFQGKAAQLDRAQKELRARAEPLRPRVDAMADDPAGRLQWQMKSLQTQIETQLSVSTPTVTVGASRLLVRLPEERIFEARGPWLSKPGQEALQTLGRLLATRPHRVVIAAPMGAGTVPRWIRGQLPTPADLSAARAGNALKSLVKGGVLAPSVLAVVGSLGGVEVGGPVLEVEIEL